MSTTRSPPIRKSLARSHAPGPAVTPSGCIDLRTVASFSYSAEDALHPLENILDDRSGPGGTYWASDRENTAEQIELRFEAPQTLSRMTYEVEEGGTERTQEVCVEVSDDSGVTFRAVLRQQFNFSPGGTTFQREDIHLRESGVTHLRLTITPHYDGKGRATLTSVRLYS
jgi:F5/8 type C domain